MPIERCDYETDEDYGHALNVEQFDDCSEDEEGEQGAVETVPESDTKQGD